MLIAALAVVADGCRKPSRPFPPDGLVARDLQDQVDPSSDLLLAPPLVGRPTATSATLNFAVAERPIRLTIDFLSSDPTHSAPPSLTHELLEAGTAHDLEIDDLQPGREYHYTVVIEPAIPTETETEAELRNEAQVHTGRFVTQRPAGESFTFALISDPHLAIPAAEWLADPGDPLYSQLLADTNLVLFENGSKLRRASDLIEPLSVDFTICLGDQFYLQDPEFNSPFRSADTALYAYVQLRRFLGSLGSNSAFFTVLGNWDGENGWHPPELIEHARRARMSLIPNPVAGTYGPASGSRTGDYYAWHWGDALFVVLNVMSYSPTRHTLDPLDQGTASDWTLGSEQFSWLENVLKSSSATFKFLLAHHPVGGKGGDELNSAYGRGGGRAARVGEQALVHQLMLDHRVTAFFYGHDHVMTDLEVDGIHYTLVGSVGAPWMFPPSETGYERQIEESGFTIVEVTPTRIEVRQLTLDPEIVSRYSVPSTDESNSPTSLH